MPYIRKIDRKNLEIITDAIFGTSINTAGEMNYLFTTIINEYLTSNGKSYQNLNDCIGALEGAKLELYRRIAAPYEDEKIKENGDVYFCD
jgi:hypothetical protein